MFKRFLLAMAYALSGLSVFFRHERNGQVQLVIAAIVVLVGWALGLSQIEWMIIVGCIAAVFAFEMVNTCIEKICNMVHPGFHPSIKIIKDIAAAAVLVVSIASAIIGLVVFLPKIF